MTTPDPAPHRSLPLVSAALLTLTLAVFATACSSPSSSPGTSTSGDPDTVGPAEDTVLPEVTPDTTPPACDPDCTAGFECIDSTCQALECEPACGDGETCQFGVCTTLNCDPACGANGTCVAEPSACLCDTGWGGLVCDGCVAEFYGPTCTACACVNGTCTDGISGDGSCDCDSGWGGALCDDEIVAVLEPGPYGNGIMDTAGDFTLETLDGPWTLSETRTAETSFVFINKYSQSSGALQIWNDSVGPMLTRSGPNVHYVFGSYDGNPTGDVTAMKARVDAALSSMDPTTAASWAGRVHYATTSPQSFGGAAGAFVAANPFLWWAIDRAQRWREIGSLYNWQTGTNSIEFFAHEPPYYDYEAGIAADMDSWDATVVTLWDKGTHAGGWGGGYSTTVEVDLPDAETMKSFDSAGFYLYAACPDHLQGKDNGCNEWDFIQQLFVCDMAQAPNADDATACTAGETLDCSCDAPGGEVVAATQTCREDGSGYDACACGCGTELVRWVTPYAREGQWLTDITPLLALLQRGGTHEFRFAGANGYTVDAQLHLYNAGTGHRPSAAINLWGKGGAEGFNQDYNDGRHAPVVFTPPANASRAEVVTVITGHGHSSTSENCAEFCNHEHTFSIGGSSHLLNHPNAGTWFGCRDLIAQGGVPNQFGTWIYGRGGWCAGMDVEPWRADVTADLDLTGENTIEYMGTFNGSNYTPTITDPGGYLPEIRMASWLVFYEPM